MTPKGTHTLRRLIVVGLAVIGAAAIAACGSSDNGSSDSSATEASAAAEESTPAEADDVTSATAAEPEAKGSEEKKRTGTSIKLGDSQFGDVLFGADNDQAIYLFVNDGPDASNCSGDCAVAWPPVLTKGVPQAKGNVDQKLLGTTKRDDGGEQVTYNGHPLYYYVNEGPNEVRCSNVNSFGGLWFAVNPAGDQV